MRVIGRIESSKLTDREMDRLLSSVAIQTFDTRSEVSAMGTPS